MRYSSFALVWGLLTALLAIGNQQQLRAQHDVFYVQLTDKQHSPYSLLRPQDFLSPRALERRKAQNIQLNEGDLPVNPAYIEQIRSVGVGIEHSSKWLNAVAIYCTDSSQLEKVKKLPFVRSIKPLGYDRPVQKYRVFDRAVKDTAKSKADRYGWAENQTKMLNMEYLHSLGYEGEGKIIAIFDGGFEQVYRMPAFDSLFLQNKILGTYDIVEGDDWVYESSGHGTDVLGVMGANMPYILVGTAPKASYYLFKTEDTKGEFWTEEFNWVVAAEKADSLGVDIINSSLGYTVFKDSLMNYQYKDINGRTGIATQGADIATQKGIIVVNSAGNEGRGKWHYIGVPADGFNVIAVGATNDQGHKAKFSSFGPTYDGRVKPNLSAQGQDVFTASMFGFATKVTSGTSFSGPIIAGSIGSFWSACPYLSNFETKQILEQSASQWEAPDSLLGYGIPNFMLSYLYAQREFCLIFDGEGYSSSPKIAIEELKFIHTNNQNEQIELKIFDQFNQLIHQQTAASSPQALREMRIPCRDWESGSYQIQIHSNSQHFNGYFYHHQPY